MNGKEALALVDKQAVQRLVIRRLAERRVQAACHGGVQPNQVKSVGSEKGVKE